jgi:hypothetical protein
MFVEWGLRDLCPPIAQSGNTVAITKTQTPDRRLNATLDGKLCNFQSFQGRAAISRLLQP